MINIKRIGIYRNNNSKCESIKKILEDKLIENDFEIVDDNPDLAIAIGGDGSFLRMIKKYNFNTNIYYVGINAGTLGFLQEIKPDEIDCFLNKLKQNLYKLEYLGIEETEVIADGISSKFYSLNEILVRDKDLNTTILNIKINDELLERYVGDGILISTSVGSTAYNLSFGGAIVYSNIHTLQITPIAPLNNKAYRNLLNPIIIPEDRQIEIIPNKDKQSLIVSVDGENNIYDNVSKIITKVNDKKIICLRMNEYDYTKVINDKFIN